MSDRTPQMKLLWVTALLLASLACRAATRLVIPDTPTPAPTATVTPTATLPPPTFTPTVIFEAACPSLLSEILAGLDSEVLFANERDEDFREDGGIFLISYEVNGSQLRSPHVEEVPDALKEERDDRAAHEAIWKYFTAIIPTDQRDIVTEFSIFTDGFGNHLAAVSPTFDDPEKWMLHVDILDTGSYHELTYTLLHEQAHLLTLNAEQVEPSKAVLRFPENETVYKQEAAACKQYFTGEGCSSPDSYINQFFDRFWTYLYDEWETIDQEEDPDVRASLLRDFYRTYEDQFLRDYAATSPAEDIAEAWVHFVLSPKPDLTSIAHEKILFFYEYPELVALREQILKQVCVEFPK